MYEQICSNQSNIGNISKHRQTLRLDNTARSCMPCYSSASTRLNNLQTTPTLRLG